MKQYDVIIVGTGPAGIFAAMELSERSPGLSVLMVEKGKDLKDRSCPMSKGDVSCAECPECAIVSGWGGAGAFSDGKLNISSDVGGFLKRYLDAGELDSLINYVDEIYIRYGAPDVLYGGDPARIEEIKTQAAQCDLEFIPTRIRHIGTDRCLDVLAGMETAVRENVDVIFGTQVEDVLLDDGAVSGVRLSDGTTYGAGSIVLAPGREGAKWLEALTKRLELSTLQNPVDIGVRVELPAAVFEHLTKVTYEPKLVFNSKTFDDRVRTFCVNPYGAVVKEYLKDIWTVNGHSYSDRKTDNTNFAILVSSTFTEPFDEPISYGRYIAGLANFLGKGVIVQRLGDLRSGRRSTHERIAKGMVRPTLSDATPGDLSFVIPYRHLCSILEMLNALDCIAPGVNSRHTLLYGLEVKFYSMQMKLSNTLETGIKNLFAVGDGAGVSRGLVQASASGVIAAREIASRHGSAG